MPTKPESPRQPSAPRGWRVEPIPSRAAYKDDAGRIRIPVWLSKNGRHTADTEIVLLPSEAELLADHLADAMDGKARAVLHELMQGSTVARPFPSPEGNHAPTHARTDR